MIARKLPIVLLSWFLILAGAGAAPKTPVPAASPTKVTIKSPADLAKALDVADLTLEMSESSYKLTPSNKTLSELISALEKFLTSRCVSADVFKTLKYDGNPSNAACLSRLKRLLEVHPQNPIALCLKDGIDSESCRAAAEAQKVSVYDGSQDSQDELIDPVLKAGLPGRVTIDLDKDRAKVEDLNIKFGQTPTEEEKETIRAEIYKIYDRMLAAACSVTSVRFIPKNQATPVPEHPRLQDLKEKFSKIPPAMRAGYQKQMLSKLEEELANSRSSPEEKKVLVEMMRVLQNPEEVVNVSVDSLQRTRLLLPQCFNLVNKISSIDGTLPQPSCHYSGWFSPQCIDALRAYQKKKAAIQKKKLTEMEAAGNSGPIDSF